MSFFINHPTKGPIDIDDPAVQSDLQKEWIEYLRKYGPILPEEYTVLRKLIVCLKVGKQELPLFNLKQMANDRSWHLIARLLGGQLVELNMFAYLHEAKQYLLKMLPGVHVVIDEDSGCQDVSDPYQTMTECTCGRLVPINEDKCVYCDKKVNM